MTSPTTSTPNPAEADERGVDRYWARRERQVHYITARYNEVKELDDGYAFRYPRARENKLREAHEYLSRHFPYFTHELEVEPHAVWLKITGPEGTKAVLKNGIDIAAGRAKRDGTEAVTLTEKLTKLGFRYATSAWRPMPDFLVIGAAKAGTTSLYSYLAEHPSLIPAFRKELYFFDVNYHRGPRYYRAFFPSKQQRRRVTKETGSAAITGEATPCYLFHPRVAERVRRHAPNAKLIVLLRNPVDRAYSYYSMNHRRGVEQLSFEEAIDKEPERLDGELEKMMSDDHYFSRRRHHFSYLARGRYAEQLENWFASFPREQFLILSNSELKRDRSGTVQRALRFIGLPEMELADTGRRNFIPYTPMADATRQRLVEYFRPHNQRLQELLGREFDWDK